MQFNLHRKSIIKKTVEVGISTLISRVFGVIREGLTIAYLGAGLKSDIFVTAFKIPNTLRKIFAEGALSSAFVPTLIHVVRKEGIAQADRLMSLAFLIFESIVLLLCFFVMWYSESVIAFLAPGWPLEKIIATKPLLHILMPFIFFISSSALLAGALQSVGHFFIPAISPVIMNVFFIVGLLLCSALSWAPTALCFFILCGGFAQFIAHGIAYFKLNFSFKSIDRTSLADFASIMSKFLSGAFSMGIVEINLIVSTRLASYLSDGTVSLIYYANRFMGIPLGVFAAAFSTILLPHFSHISAYAPKRLGFYLLESMKLIFWVTIPATLCMSFFADKIFWVFISSKFTQAQAGEAAHILIAFLGGLFFFSLNKILLNLYYARHNALLPGIISSIATGCNIVLNYLFFDRLGAVGLALALTVATGILQTFLFLVLLKKALNVTLYGHHFFYFLVPATAQVVCLSIAFLGIYYPLLYGIQQIGNTIIGVFLMSKIGFWFWVAPLIGIFALFFFFSRKLFGVKLYFLD